MKVVVLGGGYAGIICALRLARKGASVTLVNASDRFVERIRLHEAAVGRGPRVRSVARFLEGSGVELVIGLAARVEKKVVELDDGRTLPFDQLVLALGSRFERREGTVSLDGALDLEHAKSVLVVGGGLTGIEAASEIAEVWPNVLVTLATRGVVGEGFTETARAHVKRVFERMEISLFENTEYSKIDRAFDVTIWAGGFVGAALPEGLDVKTNARGQVLVDPTMRAAKDIWVCGDLAAQALPPAIPIPMGCKAAGPTAACVADNILRVSEDSEPVPVDYVAPGYCVSLGRRDGFVELAGGRVITGRVAAWIKELICKATLWAFPLERYGLINYERFGAGNVRALPVTAT